MELLTTFPMGGGPPPPPIPGVGVPGVLTDLTSPEWANHTLNEISHNIGELNKWVEQQQQQTTNLGQSHFYPIFLATQLLGLMKYQEKAYAKLVGALNRQIDSDSNFVAKKNSVGPFELARLAIQALKSAVSAYEARIDAIERDIKVWRAWRNMITGWLADDDEQTLVTRYLTESTAEIDKFEVELDLLGKELKKAMTATERTETDVTSIMVQQNVSTKYRRSFRLYDPIDSGTFVIPDALEASEKTKMLEELRGLREALGNDGGDHTVAWIGSGSKDVLYFLDDIQTELLSVSQFFCPPFPEEDYSYEPPEEEP